MVFTYSNAKYYFLVCDRANPTYKRYNSQGHTHENLLRKTPSYYNNIFIAPITGLLAQQAAIFSSRE